MKTAFIISICFASIAASAQQRQTFDLATYSVPAGWNKVSATNNVVAFAVTNNQNDSYAQVAIYASTASKGNLQSDFDSEWQELVVKTYHPKAAPQKESPAEASDGWTAQVGAAPFEFNGAQSAALLITSSGHGRCISIVVLTNTDEYQPQIQTFLESVDLEKPVDAPSGNTVVQQTQNVNSKPAASSGFHFTTTNFDDGWISTVERDWVRVTNGNIVVLLHFDSHKVDLSSRDHETISHNAWNTLVAPRYSNLSNYHVLGTTLNYDRPSLISGDVTDNQTGKRRYVALFRKTTKDWVEIVCPDRQTFITTFGVDPPNVRYDVDDSIWNALGKLRGYNKFAVDAADLTGTWTSDFSAATHYVNVYTGASAGMDTYSSNEKYEFGAGRTYKWNLGAVSGFSGNLKYQGAKSSGTFTVPNNWEISFSDIEGKPRTFSASFSCVRGGRILWIQGTGFARME